MDIRATGKQYLRIKKALDKKKLDPFLNQISINEDRAAVVPVFMTKTNDGQLIEYLRGEKPILNFIKYGFNRIIRRCPYRLHLKCIGEPCAFYHVQNGTGDCAQIWQVVK